jgi:hypothetical protein
VVATDLDPRFVAEIEAPNLEAMLERFAFGAVSNDRQPVAIRKLRESADRTVDLSAQFLTAPRSKYNIESAGTLTVSGRATHGYERSILRRPEFVDHVRRFVAEHRQALK